MSAFIDENIWEINMFPRYGKDSNFYTLLDVYYYNSEECAKLNSPKQTIQIPESKIIGLQRDKEYVFSNKKYFIENNIPIVYTDSDDNWVLVFHQIDYARYINS